MGALTVTNNGTQEEFTLLTLPPSMSGSALRCLIAGPVWRHHFKQDNELDRLLNNVHLVEPEPDSDGGNNINVNASPVPFFVTVGPATDEPRNGTGLALIE